MKTRSRTSSAAISDDFHTIITDIEHLIKDAASLSGEEMAHAKTILNARINAAKKSAGEIGSAVADRARDTAKATDSYVHENPWQAIGIGAGVGAALGLLVGVAISRR